MNQDSDGPVWMRMTIEEVAAKFADDLARARAEAHAAVDVQFDRSARESALQLEVARRNFENDPLH